jgi:phosphatidylinositol-4,5-bisphosphate 3-kinase
MELIQRDPLCEVSEQDKALVWKYRELCSQKYPQALPRLVAAVKWNSREQTAVVLKNKLKNTSSLLII